MASGQKLRSMFLSVGTLCGLIYNRDYERLRGMTGSTLVFPYLVNFRHHILPCSWKISLLPTSQSNVPMVRAQGFKV